MGIDLSVEFDNFYGIRGWYNLTGIEAIYLDSVESRLAVCLDFGERYRYIHVNEAMYPSKVEQHDALHAIMAELLDCLPHYGVADEQQRHVGNTIMPHYYPSDSDNEESDI